jgi:hypothetical protein
MLTVPGGSYVDVEECSDELVPVTGGEYEGFMYRPLLAFADTV